MKSLIKKKVSIFYLPLTMIGTYLVSYFFIRATISTPSASGSINSTTKETASVSPSQCDYTIRRLDGFTFIRPLLFVEQNCESSRYLGLKADIENLINEFKANNEVTSASVYFRDLRRSEWVSYNDTEKYYPGSLMKLVLLIAYLREDEMMPGTLDKHMTLARPVSTDKHPVYLSKSIEIGKSYPVRELLRYMISYSDNNAAYLLAENVNQTIFTKTITDMGMDAPAMNALNYPVTAHQYSYFMRTVYNSSYLSINHSEFAAELLSTCDFTRGFTAGMPAETKMIHKFGESGDPSGQQLHESGIIYINDDAYLLTVMTKGKDMQQLPEVIRSIASLVYQHISAEPGT